MSTVTEFGDAVEHDRLTVIPARARVTLETTWVPTEAEWMKPRGLWRRCAVSIVVVF